MLEIDWAINILLLAALEICWSSVNSGRNILFENKTKHTKLEKGFNPLNVIKMFILILLIQKWNKLNLQWVSKFEILNSFVFSLVSSHKYV